MNIYKRLVVGAAALALVTACDATEPPGGTTPPKNVEPTYPNVTTPVNPEDRGPAKIHPETDPELLPDGRFARRLSVDQLRRSIPDLFNGITWTLNGRNGVVNGFDVLSRTLGEADYVRTTAHNEDPSPLFAKFMDDMASDVCTKAIRADVIAGASDERLIVHDEMDPDATLRFLRLKLHGIYVPDGSVEGLSELRALYDEVAAEQTPELAWLGVCVAMLTAPEFMAY